MNLSWFSARDRRRRAAARWFIRMRGEEAERHRARFARWHNVPDNAAAYARIAQSFDSAALLRLSQPEAVAPRPLSNPMPSRTWRGALAASIALAIALPSAWLLRDLVASRPAMLMVSTGIGETRRIELADGSTIILDADSALDYEPGDSPGRAILRRGRARFESATAIPFRVEAGSLAAEAAKALFDVSIVAGGASVSSLRGEVQLGSGRTAARLAPGSAVRAVGGSIQAIALADPAWPSGMLEFRNEPLRDAIDRANRYSRTPILLAGDSLGRRRVTGAYRAGDQQGLARSLAAAFDLELVRRPGGELELRDPVR